MRRRLFVLVVALTLATPMANAAAQTDTPSQPDPRAQVTEVIPLIDPDGSLMFLTCFQQPWSPTPPTDLFSFFYSLDIVTDAGPVSVGWEIHDSQPMAWAEGPDGPFDPEIYILSNGCTLTNLGTSGFVDPLTGEPLDVTANFGSWQDEDTTEAVFGQTNFELGPDDVVSGDPSDFGYPVFDLVGMQPLEPPTTTAPTTTSTTTTTTTTPTTSVTPATQPAGAGSGSGAGGAGGGGLPPWLIILGIIAVILGGFAAVRRGQLKPGRRQPAELGRYLVDLPADQKQRVIREFRDLSPERKGEYLDYVKELVDYYTGKRDTAPQPPRDD